MDTRLPESPPVQPYHPAPVVPSSSCLFESPKDALQAVRVDFLYWTGWLTDTSFQLSCAVIAANWAVFGSADKLLTSFWSNLSVGIVFVSLGLNVLGGKWLGELHRARIEYAETNAERWRDEFQKTAGKRDPWPFTGKIENVARASREAKTWLPILAGLSFLVALLSR